jgi:hypothetical protein
MWFAEVAQLVEQPIRNRQVPGSSPGLGSIKPSAGERLPECYFERAVRFDCTGQFLTPWNAAIFPRMARFVARATRFFGSN